VIIAIIYVIADIVLISIIGIIFKFVLILVLQIIFGWINTLYSLRIDALGDQLRPAMRLLTLHKEADCKGPALVEGELVVQDEDQ
jgi:hypothetical protein